MTSIKYGSSRIDKIRSLSGLFVGTNIQKCRKSGNVVYDGFGSVTGNHNIVKANTGKVRKNS